MANSPKRPANNSFRINADTHAPSQNGAVSLSPRSSNPLQCLPQSADEVLAVFDSMSRRIDDLARELNCLGHFDSDDDHRPRAA